MNNAALEQLEKRPIWPLLVSYSLPAIMGMVAMSLYNLVDAVYVGRWCSPYAIAAMGIVFPLMNLMAAVGTLVGLGCSSTASITLGQGKRERAFRVLGHCVVLTVLSGLLVVVTMLPFLEDILIAFGAEGKSLEPAYDFMFVSALGFPVTCALMNLNHLMRASGYPKKAMWSLIISMLVNVGIAPVYMKVFGWGITGAALATVTAQLVGLVWVLIHFFGKNHVLFFKPGIYKLQGPLVHRVLSIGMPPCLLNVVGCVVVVVFNYQLKLYDGQMGVGAYCIVNRVMFLFVLVVLGITQGMQPIAGYNYGMGNHSRVRRVLTQAILAAVAVTSFGTILVQSIPEYIVWAFVEEGDADATLMSELAVHGIRIISVAFPLVGAQIVIASFFQAIGRPVMSIALNLTRQALMLLPLLLLLPWIYGEPGIWAAQPASDALSAVLAFFVLYYFIKRYFRKHDINIPTEKHS